MSEHIGADGVPMRHDGTPFPRDPSEWTDEERQYLTDHYFGVHEHGDHENEQVALAEVPDVHAEGSATA